MRALLLVLQAEAHLLASLRGNSSSTAPIDRAARPQRAAQANQNQCAFKAFSDVEELLKKRRREKGPGDFAKPLAHVTARFRWKFAGVRIRLVMRQVYHSSTSRHRGACRQSLVSPRRVENGAYPRQVMKGAQNQPPGYLPQRP